MPVTRQQIVTAARKWLDTPFAHQGRTLGRGLDCVGLPLMIAEELGLKDKLGEPLNGASYAVYSPQPLGDYVYQICLKHLVYKPTREMQPGDILSVKVLTAPCHVAMVGKDRAGRLTIIHAYSGGAAKVVEHLLDEKWRARIAGCFAYPGIEE